jgi:hypothetical protein
MSASFMTIKAVGNQTTKPIMRGCTEHKVIVKFQSKNQERNQRQYFALGLSFSPRRKSLQALSTKWTLFTLSLTIRRVSSQEGKPELWLYSEADNILKNRKFKIPQYQER